MSEFGADDTNARNWLGQLDEFVKAIDPRLEGWGLVSVMILAELLVFFGLWRHQLRIWVECRDTKSKINRNYVFQVVGRREQAQKQSWRATDELWIISTSGFDTDALNLASAKSIHCVLFKDGKATIVNNLPSRVSGIPVVVS